MVRTVPREYFTCRLFGQAQWSQLLLLSVGLAFLLTPHAKAQLPTPASARDTAALQSAYRLEDAGRWSDAIAVTGQIADPVARKLVIWRAYAEAPNPGDFTELSRFIDANPGWPARKALLAQAEKALYQERGYRDVAGWLRRHPPVSGLGHVLQAETMMASGHNAEGLALLRKSWVEDGYPSDVEADVQARFSAYLRRADYAARVDRLLWDRSLTAAQRLLPFLDPQHRIVAQVRMDLIRESHQAGQMIGTVPAAMRRDPGLLYDQVHWRRQTGLDKAAADLLETIDGATLGGAHADKWWDERSVLIRDLLKDREYRTAYTLAKDHGIKDGSDFADAEWLAGWISFRFLDDASTGYRHFAAMYDGVTKPISLARGAYWAGRAASATGRTGDAQRWYDQASRFPTTFYGQLAAEALGLPQPRLLPTAPVPTASERQGFAGREVVRATRLLADINRDRYVRMFAGRMTADARNPTEWLLIGRLFGELGRTDLEVWVGKQASYQHIVLPEIAYPRIAMPASIEVDRALAHGISRQESAFYPRAVSAAGARGLMQLMPGTAAAVARQIGLPYSLPRLTADPQYNATLGSSYLRQMVERFGGTYVLAIAAYNAGPGRVNQWLGTFGDPRTRQVDMLDWIELIPISETRNYVQRVLENTQVYRQLLGGHSAPLKIHDDIYRGARADPSAVRGRLPS